MSALMGEAWVLVYKKSRKIVDGYLWMSRKTAENTIRRWGAEKNIEPCLVKIDGNVIKTGKKGPIQ